VKPNPKTLVLNLLSAFPGGAIGARDAVAACAIFGIRETATRVALVRLSSAGLLEAAGRGSYRLGPKATKLAAEVGAWRSALRGLRDWSGGWACVYVGDLGRSDRAQLRTQERALKMTGVRELARGLYVRPDNLSGGVDALRARLGALGLEALVFAARDLDEGAEARARALWDGKALDRAYRETKKKLDGWLARAHQLDVEAQARESFLLGNAGIRQLVFDPLLPAPLVDVEERRAFVDALVRFDRAGHAIWRSLSRPKQVEARPS
jgi:phenylacetic acid degradation operon negative regulatory protein